MSSADDTHDNDYVSRTGQKQGPISVQSDAADIEDPIDPTTADSDEQLGKLSFLPLLVETQCLILLAARDDNDAIDQSNVIDQRTRHAKPSGGYREPGDEEGLPGPEDGTSVGAQ
jgi:hypothetical protein